MPHKVIKTGLAYNYDELDDKAKAKARDGWREHALEYDWWDLCYMNFCEVAGLLGITIKPRQKCPGSEPCIYFSGFSFQGDGACFEGNYQHDPSALTNIRAYAPEDERLHRITTSLDEVAKAHPGSVRAKIEHRGHYYHAGCMTIETWCATDDEDKNLSDAEHDKVVEALRDFANWMYRKLEEEHDYRLSDEVIAEEIKNNEVEFNEDGSTPVRLEKE
jgi:hypothetical protein